MPSHSTAARVAASALALTLTLIVAAAAPATAAPIVELNVDVQYGDLYFTPEPGEIAKTDEWHIDGATFGTPNGEFTVLDGEIRLVSGAFSSFNAGPPIKSFWDGPGTLDVDFVLGLSGGATHAGRFRGRIGPMVIDEGRFGNDGGSIVMDLLGGKFDAETAALFGINRHILTTPQYVFTDVFNTEFEHYVRPFGEIAFVAPEPSLLALLPLGLGALHLRRRRSRRSAKTR